MSGQGPSTNIADLIDLGNALVYIAPKQTSFANCLTATTWRKLGLMEQGAQLTNTKSRIQFFSGVPLKVQKNFYTQEDIKVTGSMIEFSAANLNRALGDPGITTATKTPNATTVKSGSTPAKGHINLTSTTGYAVGKEVEVTSGANKQYGVIQSIVGDLVTFYESLDLDITPSVGDAVKVVDTHSIVMGAVAAPIQHALWISKTLLTTGGSINIYIPTVEAISNVTLNWADNTATVAAVGIPFEFDAVSDSAVESGNLAQAIFSQA